MFRLKADIQIGSYRFQSVTSVTVTKSVHMLADTAEITMPNKFRVRENNEELFTEEALKVGDVVVIKLGYTDVYEGEEFRGYVAKINPKVPLEIICEDAFWLLKRKPITRAYNDGVKLKDLLSDLLEGTGVSLAANIPEIELGKYTIKNANAAKVLQKIKEDMGLTIYIDDNNELFAGLEQTNNASEEVLYDLNYNIVENGLEYRTSEDRKIKIKYVSVDAKNNKTEYEFGDSDGEVRTFHTSTVKDPAKLKEMAEAQLKKLKYDGYEGSVKSFLVPFASRGMSARLVDEKRPTRDGLYFINKVVTKYGMNGARRTTEISNRL